MKFKDISHSQSLETVDSYGLKHWYKSGVTIEIESQDEVDKAAKLAEQFVNEQLSKYKLGFSQVADNTIVPILEVKRTELSDEDAKDLERVKQLVINATTKAEAQTIANNNGYTYNLEIKNLINQKIN